MFPLTVTSDTEICVLGKKYQIWNYNNVLLSREIGFFENNCFMPKVQFRGEDVGEVSESSQLDNSGAIEFLVDR